MCFKTVKAMTPKTNVQNILFLIERIPLNYAVYLTSVVSNYKSLLITPSE